MQTVSFTSECCVCHTFESTKSAPVPVDSEYVKVAPLPLGWQSDGLGGTMCPKCHSEWRTRTSPVTMTELEAMGFNDRYKLPEEKQYFIVPRVCVVYRACVGGWSPPVLLIGGDKRCDRPTKDEVLMLCKALRVEVK